jgi:hypothetical protein
MEALFQIVGCVLSSEPAAERIDDFAAQVRRERGVVMAKDAQGATFVRFNALDARLVTLACQAVLGPAPSSLRFGFAAGIKEAAPKGHGAGQGGQSISNRSIEQAGDLAAGARDGEVLVSPQLAVMLIEAGFSLHSRQAHLSDGRIVPACSLDLAAGMANPAAPGGRPLVETRVTDALGTAYRTLVAQAGDMARKQGDLEARLDAALGKVALVDQGSKLATHLGELEAELDAQLIRVEDRLKFIDALEQRVDTLHAAAEDGERKLADLLARRSEIESLMSRCDALAAQVADAQHAAQAEVDNIRQISSRSKADLQYVAEHRNDVTDLRAKVEDLLGRVSETDGKIAQIESRRKTVEEVQQRATSITNMLGDINVNLEMLGEQRAVIDHVGEKLARLDFTVQEAQNTLRALQREREVAERIEQGIKALRTRNAAG